MVCRRFCESNGLIRTSRWTPRSARSQPYARRPLTATVTLLRPACSPSCWSRISVGKRCRSAQRRYIRRSISVQSVASVPPAPALIDRSAGRSSYSPEKRSAVRSREKSVSSEAKSRSSSASSSASGASYRSSTAASRSSARVSSSLPGGDLAAQAVGLAQDLLSGSTVVPEPVFLGLRLYLGDARFLGRKVKDAPRSTGSVQPGRGWRTLPPSSGPADPGAGSGAAR